MSSFVVMCNGEKFCNRQSSSPLTSLKVCIISPRTLLCAKVGCLSSFSLVSYGRFFRFDASFDALICNLSILSMYLRKYGCQTTLANSRGVLTSAV